MKAAKRKARDLLIYKMRFHDGESYEDIALRLPSHATLGDVLEPGTIKKIANRVRKEMAQKRAAK